jgi:hypothetical protein
VLTAAAEDVHDVDVTPLQEVGQLELHDHLAVPDQDLAAHDVHVGARHVARRVAQGHAVGGRRNGEPEDGRGEQDPQATHDRHAARPPAWSCRR